jgi:hypothetical protein
MEVIDWMGPVGVPDVVGCQKDDPDRSGDLPGGLNTRSCLGRRFTSDKGFELVSAFLFRFTNTYRLEVKC